MSPTDPDQVSSINQNTQGDRNQAIGQVLGGMVVYVSGGQAVFHSASTEADSVASKSTPANIGPNPYKGLMAFQETDGDRFFGREKQSAALWEKLRSFHETEFAIRVLPIYGPSGSGKSSLARAGLIPELARHLIPGYDRARVAILVPGTHPLESLATVLARIVTQDLTPVAKTREFAGELKQVNEAGEYDGLRRVVDVMPNIAIAPLVVLVDQFEEVYTLCEDKIERDALIGNLLHAAGDRAKRVTVIVTLRSDFLGETQKHAVLNRLFSEQGYLVPAMTPEELQQAIAKPAELVGHPLDTATIDLLVKDTEGREGALPLLQFALTRIWEGLGESKSPAETLKAIGGVGGALAGEAQRIYDSLDAKEQAIARRVFLGLVQLGEGTHDTRRRVAIVNLVSYQDDFDQVKRAISRFTEPGIRLITCSASSEAGDETAEVTHEALLEHWKLLNQWLDQNRDDLRFQRRLEDAAQHWQRTDCPEGNLWRPPDLDFLKRFHEQSGAELTPLQYDFFQASIDAEARREKEKKQQRQRVLLMLSIGVALLSGFSIAMAGLARFAFAKANENSLREQTATVLNWLPTAKATEGLILAIDGVSRSKELSPNLFNAAQSSLLSAVEVAREENLYRGHEDAVLSVTFSPDGQKIISGSNDGTIRLWNLQGQAIGHPFRGHQKPVRSVAISRDGQSIVSGGDDGIRLWNLQGQPIRNLFREQRGAVSSVAFSPDGQRVATAGEDGKVYLWNLQGQLIGQPFQAHPQTIYAVAFSPDGKTIASAGEDQTIRLWNLQGRSLGQPFRGHQDRVRAIAFNRDGTRIVSGGKDGTVRLWNLQGKEISPPLQGHKDGVRSVAFSPDGLQIASAGQDGTIRLWNESGTPIGDPLRGEGAVFSVQFSPDGKRLISGGWDKTLRLWDLQKNPLSQSFRGHEETVFAIAFSPDGKTIATGSKDRTVRLWDLQGNSIGQPFRGHQSSVWSVAFSPDGKMIVSTGRDSTIRLWNLQGNPVRQPFRGHQKPVTSVIFSPDGQRIVSGSHDGTIRLWDLQGRSIGQPFRGHESEVLSAVVSPDGKRIVSGGNDSTIRFWNLDGHPIGQPIQQDDAVRAIALSKNGQMIVSGSDDGTVRLWDANGNSIAQPFRGHISSVTAVAFSPDNRIVASSGSDGTIRLWDLEGNPIGSSLEEQENTIFALAFSPDGQYLLSGGEDYLVKRWYSAWESWLQIACRRLSHHPYLQAAPLDIDSKVVRNVQKICTAQ